MTLKTSPGVGFTVSKNEIIFRKEKSYLNVLNIQHTKKISHSDGPKKFIQILQFEEQS